MSGSSIFKTYGYALSGSGGGGGSPVSTDNLIAYWNFDSVPDLASITPTFGSSSYTLLANINDGFQGDYPPPTATTGKVGSGALQFTAGTGEGLFIPTGNFPLLVTFTISCWVKLTGNYNNNNAVCNHWDGSGSNWNFYFGIAPDNRMHIAVGVAGTLSPYFEAIASNVDFTDGNWHYCVAQSDGSTFVRVNIDNTGWHSTSMTGSLAGGVNDVPFLIGRNTRQGVFTGSMQFDELGIWTRVLTDEEIISLYNNGNGLAYPFSGGGDGNKVLAKTPARILIKGYIPPTPPAPPLVTTGLTSWLDISNSQSYSGSGTTINDLSPNAGNAVIVNGASYDSESGGEISLNGSNQYIRTNNDLGQYYSSVNESVFIWVKPSGAGQIITEIGFFNTAWHDSQIEIHNDGTIHFSTWHGNTSYPQRVVSSPQQFNQWYLLGFTYNGTTLTAYINGQAIGTTNLSRLAPYYNGYGLAYYLGYADTTNMGVYQYLNSKIGAFYAYNRPLTPEEVLQNFDATKSRYLGGGGGSSVIVGDSSINDNLQAFWNFDETSGPREDATGNGYIISEVNGTIPSGNGVVAGGGAANITNGNSSWLKLPAGICDIGTGEKSFSIWFKLNQTSIGYQWIWMQGHNYDYANNNIVYIEANSTLNTLFLTNTENHWTYNLGNNIVPTAGVWHHYVGTYSGSQFKGYYDGNLVGQTNYSGSISTDNTEYTLGRYNGLPSFGAFSGLIDDVGIWNRVLTPDDVAYLYNSGQGRQYPLNPTVYIPPKFKIITRGYVTPVPQNPFVTDGLILLLDATDIASYPGTGATWIDTSGNNNNFNINPAAWNPSGYMDFKGSYGCAKNSSDISLSGDVTYLCVTRIRNSTFDWRTLTRSYINDHHVIVQNGGWNIGMYNNDNDQFIGSGYSQQSLPGYASNTFDVMCWRWTNNDNPTYALNVDGVDVASITNPNARYNRGFGALGAYHNGNTNNPNNASQFWGDIKLFAVYNRRLTDEEVIQNYNAMVAKFGL
ncbi:MAG: hypothetical protein EBU90_00370 [Proteobacteria bacterium]|nr:hypothetical protein [Pseudomonadota bacterium]NBP12885.1 hypothetical protein [bacterium]